MPHNPTAPLTTDTVPRRALVPEPEASGRPVPPNLGTLVEEVGRLATQVGRTDLVERLLATRRRLQDPNVRVVVVGEFKQGKSKLINALVNAPACPIDDDVATSVPTSVGYGDQPSAFVFRKVDGEPGKDDVVREPIPLEALAEHVSEAGNPGNEKKLLGAEVLLPRELLKGGLRLIDSPGVGSLDSASALSTLSALSSAHAVLLVSDASQEYTDPEVQLLKRAMRLSPNVAAVLAKTDLYPDWRDIATIDRKHLTGIGELPLFPVSSDLRLLAATEQDRELNTESGFPALVAHLRAGVLARAETIVARSALHDVTFVVEQMTLSARTELTALSDPEGTPRLLAELEDAKARADDFRSRSSRWQVALSDGVADLISDMEHDLRDRLRRVQREAEQAIDEGDPGPIWEQLAEWIDQRVASGVSETFVWTDERSQWLTDEIAEIFAQEQFELPRIAVGSTDGLLDPVERLPGFDPGNLSAGEKIYIGVRGSYGGVLMVGLATGLIGLSLINPLSLLAGVLVGRRAYREDMNARLTRRRFEAKNIVRRYIDEVTFQVSKQLKDRLRLVQRTNRDHFGAIAEQTHRSLADAVLAAKQSAGTYASERDQRIQVLQGQLRELDQVARRMPALPAGSPEPAVAR
ncbi:dynamin family protein [Propioniciclava sinopodophylli]|uniref:dynamin family protein n=1 Tax=Propioniciclava sinopodophylli TaxID=1837344 RepID=UPI002491E8AD|nr:dynamin family protein [Propioniciclava sinopodophylli]